MNRVCRLIIFTFIVTALPLCAAPPRETTRDSLIKSCELDLSSTERTTLAKTQTRLQAAKAILAFHKNRLSAIEVICKEERDGKLDDMSVEERKGVYEFYIAYKTQTKNWDRIVAYLIKHDKE